MPVTNHCEGCHNPQTWDFNGGFEFTQDTLKAIINGLQANGIKRSLAIQGGEPLAPDNQFLTDLIITSVKEALPDTEIYIWTGYTIENIPKGPRLKHILENTDVIVDGPFILSQRDITLPLRGSRNQRIINLKEERKKKNDNYNLRQYEI